jgi:5-methylcytosine-specific restriction protein B
LNSNQNIFIFTAGDPAARAHLVDSILMPIDQNRVLEFFDLDDRELVSRINTEHGLYAWGAVPGVQNNPRWSQIKAGDWMLCVFDSTYQYVAQVVAKFDNQKFAKEIWGETEDGKTWQLMYFLTKPVAISIKTSELSDFLSKGYMGFSRISEEKISLIEKTFGSVQKFIASRLLAESSVSSVDAHPLDSITKEDVLEALQLIDSGEMSGFGPSSDYDLLFQDKRYPPKAAVGIATKRTLGRVMRPDEFSSGVGSKNFRVLKALGFEIVEKQNQDQYFLIRSNPNSPYGDQIGSVYHFTNNVANSKKLQGGGFVVIDSKTEEGLRLIGHGQLKPAAASEQVDDVRHFAANFSSWTHFEPTRKISSETLALLQAQSGYNLQHAVRPISKELYMELVGQDRGGNKTTPAVVPYDLNSALNELLISREAFEAMLESLQNKKNLILQGPPGTGKSFVAKRLAYALLGFKDDSRIESVQFHQSFSYEDFIQGFRPKKDGSGFSLKDGVFYRFCRKALIDPTRLYVFIIDEINRGNLSKIFGEVMLLIETDKRGPDWAVSLTYSDESTNKFYIPSNVHILGMMNTADRSLAIVDYALRRRFAFKDISPGFESEKFEPLLESKGVERHVIAAIQTKMAALNKEIESSVDLGRGFAIGHSFFVPFINITDSKAWYDSVINNEIVPLLREYWFDKKQSEVDQRVQSLRL